METVEDETGFDGLSETHFIGEEHAGGESPGDLGGNSHLVGEEIDATTEEPTHRGLHEACLAQERFHSEVVGGQLVDLAAHEPILGL